MSKTESDVTWWDVWCGCDLICGLISCHLIRSGTIQYVNHMSGKFWKFIQEKDFFKPGSHDTIVWYNCFVLLYWVRSNNVLTQWLKGVWCYRSLHVKIFAQLTLYGIVTLCSMRAKPKLTLIDWWLGLHAGYLLAPERVNGSRTFLQKFYVKHESCSSNEW